MKSFFRKGLSCLICLILVFGSCVSAFAANNQQVTPVIVINDIDKNPLYNTDDGSVVFNWADYQHDILFTDGFSENFLELFSKETIEAITSGDMGTLDIIMLLLDYFGYMGDINNIITELISFVTGLMANMGGEELSLEAILGAIDFKQILADLKSEISTDIENMKLIAMNADGTPKNANIGAISREESLEYYYDDLSYDEAYALAGDIGEETAETIGYENTYVFAYDWRLAPSVNAELLNAQIEKVKSECSADKVSVISEGYGSVIATEYLAKYDNAEESIHNFVTVSSEFLGTSLVGDLFTNQIVNEYAMPTYYTSAYLRYMNDLSDNPITAFSTWLINYILNNEWQLQEFCVEVEKIIADLHFVFIASGTKAELAKMPGIWALVPAESFELATEKMFAQSAADAQLLDVITEYNEHQLDYEAILQDAQADGINISVVSLWDLQIIPIGQTNSVQSDGIVDTAYSSFGATCVEINDVTAAMRAVQYNEDGHMHQSETYDMLTPWYQMGGICRYIDASTCALPENTWFIKNMKHGTFSYESNSMDFLMWLLLSEEPTSVWQRTEYKQFMTYNRYINPGILSSGGITAPDADVVPEHYLLGDINLDGLVTALDAKLAFEYAAGKFTIEEGSVAFINGDVYADGVINAADARKILLMSSGLIEDMQSGIKFEYDTDASGVELSSYTLELRPEYNSITNRLMLDLVLLDAADAICGNFSLTYDDEMYTYYDADESKLLEGTVVAGEPTKADNTITCSFAVTQKISSECDVNGDLTLASFYFDVSRQLKDVSSFTGGTVYFYDTKTKATYIAPVELELEDDFFFMLGDANNNRYITAEDARMILRIAARLDSVYDDAMFRRCDVNGDGKITASDARLVLRAAARLITSFDEDASDSVESEVEVE